MELSKMKTLYENIVRTENLNCSKIEIDFYDYDLQQGMRFQYKLYTPKGFVLDGGNVDISGADFQNWPSAPEGQEAAFDETYIIEKILEKLNLQKDNLVGL
jgi:intergrase/recombinase